MRCIKWCSPIAILFFCLPLSANTESSQATSSIETKLASYSQLVATAIFHWNLESDISNQDIIELLKRSGLQEDTAQEAIVFRHLLATATANDIGDSRIPIFVKQPLLEKHWQQLKGMNPTLYAASKAFYIFSKNANKFDDAFERVKYTVPGLTNLKMELLNTEKAEATAIASIWLAMELSVASPIQAISEIEYALPHLPKKSTTRSLENYLSSSVAHDWLRASYMELSVPSRAYHHAFMLLNETADNDFSKTWAYFSAIDALIMQNKYAESIKLSEKAIEFVNSRPLDFEKYLIYLQKFRVLVFDTNQAKRKELNNIQSKIESLDESKVNAQSEELVAYYSALKSALNGDEEAFRSSIKRYKRALYQSQARSQFKSLLAVTGELELSRLYEVFGDNDLAYHHLKNYNAILVKKNSEQFKVNDASFADSILKDIELARFRREELNELRAERLGLSEDNEQKTNTIYLLIVVIATILLIWRRIAGNQKAKSNSAR